jgi:hypothetical protein
VVPKVWETQLEFVGTAYIAIRPALVGALTSRGPFCFQALRHRVSPPLTSGVSWGGRVLDLDDQAEPPAAVARHPRNPSGLALTCEHGRRPWFLRVEQRIVAWPTHLI